MYPAQSDATRMDTIKALRDHYGLPNEVRAAFTAIAGDSKEDTRLLAVLPGHVVTAALERSQLGDGSCLSAVQASHVGLGWNLARRIQHTKNGGDWDSWTEDSPFREPKTTAVLAATMVTPVDPLERKFKMTQILDQNDDGDFVVQSEEARARWYQQYMQPVGGWPPEEEDPMLEQLSIPPKNPTPLSGPPGVRQNHFFGQPKCLQGYAQCRFLILERGPFVAG